LTRVRRAVEADAGAIAQLLGLLGHPPGAAVLVAERYDKFRRIGVFEESALPRAGG